MTEVIEELQLTEIIEVAQTKLIKNFMLLGKRFNKTDQDIQSQKQQQQIYQKKTNEQMQRLEQLIIQQQSNHALTVERLTKKIDSLQQNQKNAATQASQIPISIKKLNDELFNTQLQFQEKYKMKQIEIEELMKHIHTLALEQNRLHEEINNKENKAEAEKIVKETEVLKNKNSFIEGELKLANHKIEKMEILNQKAQRMQAKKELEIMKEIEERVKKELKVSMTTKGSTPSANIQPTNSYTIIQGNQNNTPPLSQFANGQRAAMSNEEGSNMGLKKMPSIVTEEQILNMSCFGTDTNLRNSMDNIIEKYGDKMKHMQTQIKEIKENLKVLNRGGSSKKPEGNKENTEGIQDKINEIKPEMVKIWAKIDTIEDRITFSERKVEEKLKGVNELANLVKQNNISRLDQKLKGLQTEIFTTLKEIKSKLQTKVNQSDYDKYKNLMEDRIGQINDLIYLKSDKLEVKKALLFLESKIKQIILVISQDEENEKDALLTKKQLKCISCDKELDKFSGMVSSPKGNWDSLPYKDHPPEILGRFGMTNFGSLAKKIKKLEGKDLPLLNKRNANQSFQNSSS